MKNFKSNLKVKYDCNLGMWLIKGNSLQRTDIKRKFFNDKNSAITFKNIIDTQDFHYYWDNILNNKL